MRLSWTASVLSYLLLFSPLLAIAHPDSAAAAPAPAEQEDETPQPTKFNGIEVPPLKELSGKDFDAEVKDGYWYVESRLQEHNRWAPMKTRMLIPRVRSLGSSSTTHHGVITAMPLRPPGKRCMNTTTCVNPLILALMRMGVADVVIDIQTIRIHHPCINRRTIIT